MNQYTQQMFTGYIRSPQTLRSLIPNFSSTHLNQIGQAEWQPLESTTGSKIAFPKVHFSTIPIIENSTPYTVPSSCKLASVDINYELTIFNELLESSFLQTEAQSLLIPELISSGHEGHHFNPPASSNNLFELSAPLCPANT